MAVSYRLRAVLRRSWSCLRLPFWLGLGLLVGFGAPYTLVLNRRVQARFNDLVFSVPTRVYAQPLPMQPGAPMRADALKLEWRFAGYVRRVAADVPGSWSQHGQRFTIDSRGYVGPAGGASPRRVELVLGQGHMQSLRDLASGKPLAQTHLDPARIATLYGAHQEERRIVQLKRVPPLLVTGLQAVEDRDFKHHVGIDISAILRAAWADLRAGRVVQGGSTLTQQLVRNLFLDRNQNLLRKVNEALLSMLIEAHYSKGRILQAYINEVFLGQQGRQAVHGFAAASEFYFGRRLQALRTQDIALLVGMVRGPSYYDPRRYPERALARRNRVLSEFYQTGLISAVLMRQAQSTPLGVNPNPQLPRNRFPAFLDLVRTQITTDFDEQTLRKDGLSIFTTLDPAAQLVAEQAVTHTLDRMGRRGKHLQAAAVVTAAASGRVLAVVGGRDPGVPGFNRALYARRPVGSIIKPFVYLVALADPDRWSLAKLLRDEPISLRQPNGKRWAPQNDDHLSHGEVPLIDALVRSLNQATVYLGLQIGVDRVHALLGSLGLRHINPNPSLLLGAVDLSPLQVAQIYQYFAAGAHALPLVSVRGVLDHQGRIVKRYQTRLGQAQYAQAAALVPYAMQQVTVRGTAHSLGDSALSWLHAAGKTGTSDDQRDSWFAGFTGAHLAVVWVGRDDNQPTHLWGSSGALRVWEALLARLPSRPLSPDPGPGLQMAWVNPKTGNLTDQRCHGATEIPFMDGHLPTQSDSCFWQRLQDIFDTDHTDMPPAQTGGR